MSVVVGSKRVTARNKKTDAVNLGRGNKDPRERAMVVEGKHQMASLLPFVLELKPCATPRKVRTRVKHGTANGSPPRHLPRVWTLRDGNFFFIVFNHHHVTITMFTSRDRPCGLLFSQLLGCANGATIARVQGRARGIFDLIDKEPSQQRI